MGESVQQFFHKFENSIVSVRRVNNVPDLSE